MVDVIIDQKREASYLDNRDLLKNVFGCKKIYLGVNAKSKMLESITITININMSMPIILMSFI